MTSRKGKSEDRIMPWKTDEIPEPSPEEIESLARWIVKVLRYGDDPAHVPGMVMRVEEAITEWLRFTLGMVLDENAGTSACYYCRNPSWTDETQAVLDSVNSEAALDAAWKRLEEGGSVDSHGSAEYYHALSHLWSKLATLPPAPPA
jgi:hypothetical protein